MELVHPVMKLFAKLPVNVAQAEPDVIEEPKFEVIPYPSQLLAYMDILHVKHILDGSEVIVTHAGTSQYTGGGGLSACGLAAMNCARVLLGKEQAGLRDDALLMNIVSRATMEVAVQIFSPDICFLISFSKQKTGSYGDLFQMA